jgi:hypothetical protein
MEETMVMNDEQTENFFRCLSILRDTCVDADIKGGLLRQRTSDKTSIFEIDLTPLITEVDLPLSNLKQKLDLFKIFSDTSVQLDVSDENFSFKDEHSILLFKTPVAEYFPSEFINENELNNIFTLSEDNLLIEKELSTVITDRIKIVTQVFNTPTVQVRFNGTVAAILANVQSKDQEAQFCDNIETNNIDVGNQSTQVVAIPFLIDHDTDIYFRMYSSDQPGVVFSKFSTQLGDVDINVYTRSAMLQEDDEESAF